MSDWEVQQRTPRTNVPILTKSYSENMLGMIYDFSSVSGHITWRLTDWNTHPGVSYGEECSTIDEAKIACNDKFANLTYQQQLQV